MNLDQGVVLAILTHAAATIWWASKMNTTLSFILKDMKRVSDEVLTRHTETQAQLKAIWTRVDEMREEIFQPHSHIK